MEKRNIQVAVVLNDEGKCEHVAHVRLVGSRELNRLENEKEYNKAVKLEKETQIISAINELREMIVALEHEIKVLKGEE